MTHTILMSPVAPLQNMSLENEGLKVGFWRIYKYQIPNRSYSFLNHSFLMKGEIPPSFSKDCGDQVSGSL